MRREYDKDIMASIFKRKGQDGAHIKLFSNIDAKTRDALLNIMPDLDWDTVVIASYQDRHAWLIITTQQIIVTEEGVRAEYALSELDDATIDLHAIQREKTPKSSNDELIILRLNGTKYTIKVEPGAPFSGVWNVLKFVATKNHSANK